MSFNHDYIFAINLSKPNTNKFELVSHCEHCERKNNMINKNLSNATFVCPFGLLSAILAYAGV